VRIVTVVGARPQFIKAGALSRAIARQNAATPGVIEEIIVHTGQHYDHNMSRVFFDELDIPEPDYTLETGSGYHGAQTGRMLERIEDVLLQKKPDVVLVYGDTNSTLAGALAAAKMHIRVAHVEAGLRSYNKKMPEEINRVLTDHISTWLFCPTQESVRNLERENVTQGVHLVGDIMYDSMIYYQSKLCASCACLERLGLQAGAYFLATVHRAENTDDPARLEMIFSAFASMAASYPVIVALHPRTKERMKRYGLDPARDVRVIDPVSYLEMIELESNARAILTDSGGVQKEAFFVQRPCITLREETEWVETIACDANELCGATAERILNAYTRLENGQRQPDFGATPYGNGRTAERILQILSQHCD